MKTSQCRFGCKMCPIGSDVGKTGGRTVVLFGKAVDLCGRWACWEEAGLCEVSSPLLLSSLGLLLFTKMLEAASCSCCCSLLP